ncbi:MAG: ZIP family metal transporter [Candidatus Levybacteria bacterium]|nr:ZIP family metal transporter [Candidatus Levybacteria bacterium]
MSTIIPILLATLLGSIGALAGGFLLLFSRKRAQAISHVLVPFAAGALLATGFFELLPEASEHAVELGQDVNVFYWALGGVLLMYLLERGIHWFQYHRKTHKGVHGSVTVPLIILSDSAHNFIDGVAIAITFLVNPSLGIVTTLAVAAHELPQEIGDFAVLLHAGLSRKKIILYNILSALLAVVGAVLALAIGEQIRAILPIALALTTGFFLYIALNSLLPEIHHEEKKGYAFLETTFLFLGVVVIWVAITLLEGNH